jgi:membrane protein YqaA with SNARE-associated domain
VYKKLATSFMLASALVGALVLPTFAASTATSASDESTFQSIVFFPVRVVGSGVGAVVGVPLGAVKDGVKGAQMGTQWVADKLGKEDGTYETWAGAVLGGPVGLLGGAAYGTFDGGWHGVVTGYEKPFSKDAFTFKEE